MNVQDIKTRFIWDLVLVYGDAQPKGKARFLAELSSVLQGSINPILIRRDFNISWKGSEKKQGTPGHWCFLRNAVLQQAGLREFELHGG